MGGHDYVRVHGAEKHAMIAESDLGSDRVWRFDSKAPASAQPAIQRIAAALAVFAAALGTFAFVGEEFMPTLDEQNFNLSSVRIPSTSIAQSVRMDLPLERAILALPEVNLVF